MQRIVARLIATSPAGHKLCLVGGFRYRLLDQSARVSQDLDYHWPGDLSGKRDELLRVMDRRVIPQVRQQLGYEGNARSGSPADESDWLRTIHLAFWKSGVAYSRVEIPVEITRIQCHDKPLVKVVDGTVYLTSSDADMLESKVVALFRRHVVEHRDFCDIFLFADHFRTDSAERLKRKLSDAGVSNALIRQRLMTFSADRHYHANAVEQVVRNQLDSPAAAAIMAAGGGEMILDEVSRCLTERLDVGNAGAP